MKTDPFAVVLALEEHAQMCDNDEAIIHFFNDDPRNCGVEEFRGQQRRRQGDIGPFIGQLPDVPSQPRPPERSVQLERSRLASISSEAGNIPTAWGTRHSLTRGSDERQAEDHQRQGHQDLLRA